MVVDFRKFFRSQGTALLATLVDYSSLLFLVEILKIYYVWAVATAAFLGALTNYFSNRYWAFESSSGSIKAESSRYAVVSIGSMIWNTLLVWLFTDYIQLVYYESKILVAIIVGWFWNYPLHKYWVFIGDQENENAKKDYRYSRA